MTDGYYVDPADYPSATPPPEPTPPGTVSPAHLGERTSHHNRDVVHLDAERGRGETIATRPDDRPHTRRQVIAHVRLSSATFQTAVDDHGERWRDS